VVDEVVGYGVEDTLRHLSAAGTVEVGDGLTIDRALEGGELAADVRDIEVHRVAAPVGVAGYLVQLAHIWAN
jgi:hypothetical protein